MHLFIEIQKRIFIFFLVKNLVKIFIKTKKQKMIIIVNFFIIIIKRSQIKANCLLIFKLHYYYSFHKKFLSLFLLILQRQTKMGIK